MVRWELCYDMWHIFWDSCLITLLEEGHDVLQGARAQNRFHFRQVERENKEAAARARQATAAAAGGGWFAWIRGTGATQPPTASDAEARGQLSEAEYRKIMQIVTQQEDALATGTLADGA